MTVLVLTHEQFAAHDPGRGHPERPARLQAVLDGITAAGLGDAVRMAGPRPATRADLERVHLPNHLAVLEELDRLGGGRIDADTSMSGGSLDAAILAAGAGLTAVDALDAGTADAVFCAVRPPGHHATPGTSMGFCLLNNVAVTAAALADRGERVLVVDIDAHHGNGTQDAFWDDPRVVYVSMHQYPFYPGTGGMGDVGGPGALGATINVPLPAGTGGDAYRAVVDEVIHPAAQRLDPTWLLISAGFDAHRADPLTDLALSSGDVGALTASLVSLAPPGRTIAFLEGGYDLAALADCAGACVAALVGDHHAPEAPTSASGRGRDAVAAAARVHAALS